MGGGVRPGGSMSVEFVAGGGWLVLKLGAPLGCRA